MAFTTYFTRIGAAKVKLPIKQPTLMLPNCNASLPYTVSVGTPTSLVVNDVNNPLDITGQYYFTVACLGGDAINNGLTITAAASVVGPLTISNASTQAFLINVAASNFPANLSNSFAMGVWMRKNSSNYALQGYYVVDPNGNDFNCWVTCEPLASQTLYPIATLQSAVQDNTNYPELGSRAPYGCSFGPSLRTTGGVDVGRQVDTVPVNPDNAPNYPQPINRGYALRFSVLQNTMVNVVLANAGKYAKGTVNGGHTVQTAQMSLQTAVAQVTGNLPFQLIMPPDNNKVSEIRYYLACIQQNLQGANERWSKDATSPLQFLVSTVNLDPLLNDVDCEISYGFQP